MTRGGVHCHGAQTHVLLAGKEVPLSTAQLCLGAICSAGGSSRVCASAVKRRRSQ